MIGECDYAISNAEKFSEMLSKDLSVLDGENISSIMGSEDQVSKTIDSIRPGNYSPAHNISRGGSGSYNCYYIFMTGE